MILLVGYVIYLSTQSQKTSSMSILIALVYLLGLITIGILVSFGFSKLILSVYPHYQGDVFYAGQFYNHKWYLITCIGLVATLSWLTIFLYNRRSNVDGLKSAALILMALLAIGAYVFVPTASYFIMFPVLALSITYWIYLRGQNSRLSILSPYLLSTLGLGLWIPILTMIFLAFSIVGLPGPTLLTILICLATMILFQSIWTDSKLLLYGGLLTMATSLIMGHLTSTPTSDRPLPSSLFYNYDTSTGQGHIATDDHRINLGNMDILSDASKVELQLPHKRSHWAITTEIEPHVSIPKIVIDSTNDGHLQVISPDEVYLTRLYLDNTSNVSEIYINGQAIMDDRESDGSFLIDAYAMRADTLDILIDRTNLSASQVIGINSHFLSLPMTEELPDHILRTDGFTGIVQHIEL